MSRQPIIAFDLDDTLCHRPSGLTGIDKYHASVPDQRMVSLVNECHDAGYRIIIFTARGMAQFDGSVAIATDALFELTKKQLISWGIKHDLLIMGKPEYDLLVDDKTALPSAKLSIEDINARILHARYGHG